MSLICTPAPPVIAVSTPAVNLTAARVLHVINGEHYAGAERVQDLLSQHLGAFGFDVGLACLKPGDFPRVRHAQHVPLDEVPMAGRLDLSPAWRLARLIRRERYHLIHSHTARSALVAGLASLMTGVPLVHHLHSPTAHDTTHPWRDLANSYAEIPGLRRASALIAVSHAMAEHAR